MRLFLLAFFLFGLSGRAAISFNGTSDYITTSAAVVTGPPFSMACWYYPTATDVTLIAADTVSGTDGYQLGIDASGGGRLYAMAYAGATIFDSRSVGESTQNAWNHACGVYTANNDRLVYLNGSAATPQTTNVPASAVDNFHVGTRWYTTRGAYFAGNLAEVAVWNAVLSAADVSALSKGFSPLCVRPSALVFYAPLIRNTQDVRGGKTLTASGTAAADHPRIYR